MKKIVSIAILIITTSITLKAQIPYFSSTVGNGKLYGYTSIKFRPGKNAQETYTTFQYGLSNYGAVGLDLYTSNGSAYSGFLIRGGYTISKWVGIGAQITPSFNLSNSFKFSYLTSAIYLNGNINANGKFFWCSNTWITLNEEINDNTYMNWEYIGMNISISKNQSITPMIGTIHSWLFNQEIDLAIGAFYTLANKNFYLWFNDLCKSHPRIVIGIDFCFL